jgi:hypothetical protein
MDFAPVPVVVGAEDFVEFVHFCPQNWRVAHIEVNDHIHESKKFLIILNTLNRVPIRPLK